MEGPGPHRVTMRPGSRAEKDCGFGLTLTGGIAFTFGGVAWWTARFVDASAATRTGYAITTVTGLAALVTGIALLVDRRKFAEVRSPTQGSGWLRIATGESPSEGHLPCRAVAAQRARWQRNA